MDRSLFIAFDGIDGCGKSTQVERFARWQRGLGQQVVCFRDPGSTTLGEELRGILLGKSDRQIAPTSEMLLYMAARAQLVDEQISPALREGQMVVTDRYLLANVAYQGYGGGLDVPSLWAVGEVATAGRSPDLTFLLDVDVETAARRRGATTDRMEGRGAAYFQRVREGFLTEAANPARKIVIVDATRPIDQVQQAIQDQAQQRLSP